MSLKNVALDNGGRHGAQVTVDAAEFCDVIVAIGNVLRPHNYLIFIICIEFPDQIRSI